MKNLLFLSILFFLSTSTVLAQGDLDDFDFFEQEGEGDYSKKKKKNGGKSKDRKVKSLLGGYAFYHIPGNMTLSAGFYGVNTPRSIAIPNPFDIEITVFKNVTLGLRYVYFNYKPYEYLDSTTYTVTSWTSRDHWIGDRTFAGMLTVHLSEYIGVEPDKYDVYVRTYFGSNNIKIDNTVISIPPYELETAVVGGGLGVRYIYNSALSGYVDVGYSRFGLVNFGITYRFWNLQF